MRDARASISRDLEALDHLLQAEARETEQRAPLAQRF